jgi:antitoxin component of MazEF toxin-antitoxin module
MLKWGAGTAYRIPPSVMGKLDARDRAQVVALAYEWGLVQPGHAPVPNG